MSVTKGGSRARLAEPLWLAEELAPVPWLFGMRKALKAPDAPSSLRYVHATPAGLALVRMSVVSVEPQAFRMLDIRDEAGDLVRLKLAYHDLAGVQAAILKESPFASAAERLPVFLEKSIAAEGDFLNPTMWRALFLVHVAKHAAAEERRPGRPLLFLYERVWQREIREYAEALGVDVAWVPRLAADAKSLFAMLLPPFAQRMKSLDVARRGRDVARLLLERKAVVRDGRGQEPVPVAPKLMVEYYGQLNLDRPELHSDFFFWQMSHHLAGSDILVAHRIPEDPVDAAFLGEVSSAGMSVVALDPRASANRSVPVYRPWPTPPARRSASSSLSLEGREGRWLRRRLGRYDVERDWWARLFELTGARVWTSWYKYGPTHCAVADAMASVGGITTLWQRAYEDLPGPECTVATDVFFGFSPNHAALGSAARSVIPYHVAVGYLGDHRFPLVKQEAVRIRERLTAAGARFVLALFDENSADDERWHVGHGIMRSYYALLLEKVLANRWLGLICKPKVARSLRQRLGLVAELLERAEETGRCVILEGGALQNPWPPAVAALAADMTVHGHLAAATAGIEAALAGSPTLLYDGEGWKASPLHALGDKIVFSSLDDMWEAVAEHASTPGGVPGLGDWSPFLDEFDPFRDGRAAERMGDYLALLLEGLKAGRSRDAVLADAAERYTTRWGDDKVCAVSPRRTT